MIKKIIVFIFSVLGGFSLMIITLLFAILKQMTDGSGNWISALSFALGGWIGASLIIFFLYKKWKMIQRLLICLGTFGLMISTNLPLKNDMQDFGFWLIIGMGVVQAAIMEN
jgi:hypothetical protein